MPKITPNLWFDMNAEEAANFYVSIFPNSKVGKVAYYTDAGPGPAGTAVTVEWTLDGQDYVGINGGPMFPFTEAVSLEIRCKDQAEVDYYWEKLLEGGGRESQCGWLKDRFGFNWQVTPQRLIDLMTDKDPEVVKRVTAAMLTMVKLDVAALEAAARG
ncbi:VOC family protein [Phenylobacterium sp. J367]|uniref:VOC family protein n=1 Tax=Phenylobacterium sp. J367 TaxID=2898435 RepID=UPI002151663B|nr:VOC family protein [Phenylobacterium sp. J367]MCR5877674.1 VOC family protein [Phenylobacterium sp. J367]